MLPEPLANNSPPPIILWFKIYCAALACLGIIYIANGLLACLAPQEMDLQKMEG
jgi:hypothetical protein